jgi:hypothetical protein
MTTQLPYSNTVPDLLQLVKNVLSGELGQFQNGVTAVWVEPPEAPKAGTGIHVYISRFTQQLSSKTYQWSIRIVQLDTSLEGLNVLDRAIANMRRQFPNRREVILPYADNRFPGANFYIPFELAAYHFS